MRLDWKISMYLLRMGTRKRRERIFLGPPTAAMRSSKACSTEKRQRPSRYECVFLHMVDDAVDCGTSMRRCLPTRETAGLEYLPKYGYPLVKKTTFPPFQAFDEKSSQQQEANANFPPSTAFEETTISKRGIIASTPSTPSKQAQA